jgi:SAM-dependent methyltransferase
LDLGCGTATNLAYLAGLGLTAIGVELASNALARGRARLAQEQAALLPHIHLVQGDVARVPFHALQASYVLDIGCFHALPFADRPGYVQGVVDNLASGGYYQLFAFDLLPDADRDPAKLPRGVAEHEIAERFAPHLQVVEVIQARPDRQPCRWYLLQRR